MRKLVFLAAALAMTLTAAAQTQEAYPSYIQVNGRAEKEIVREESDARAGGARARAGRWTGRAAHFRRQIRRADPPPRVQNDHAFDKIAQFAHVAGPGVGFEALQSFGREIRRNSAVHGAQTGCEAMKQRRDIGPSLAQGRQVQRHDAQPVVEIFPKRAGGNGFFKILVGGGHHPHIHPDGAAAAHPLEGLLLKDAQDLGLGLQAHVTDLVKKQRALVGHFKPARPRGFGAGERALFMPEQLAFDQFLGNGGAVHRDHGRARATAPRVQGARGKFLASAVFPGQQNPGVGRGHLEQLGLEFQHGRRLTEQLLPFGKRGAQEQVLAAQGGRFNGPRRQDDDLFQRQRLFDKIVRPAPNGGNGCFNGPVARNHHHRHIGMIRAQQIERGKPVHAGKPDIQKHEIERLAVGQGQAAFRIGRFQHLHALVFQNAAQGKADRFLIVNDQYPCRHQSSPMPARGLLRPLCHGRRSRTSRGTGRRAAGPVDKRNAAR